MNLKLIIHCIKEDESEYQRCRQDLHQNIMSGLGTLTLDETIFTGIVLESFFYGTIYFIIIAALYKAIWHHSCLGLYSALFIMYVQRQASKKVIDKTKNILIYPLCALFTSSTAAFFIDIIGFTVEWHSRPQHFSRDLQS